jgi:hypothetical protein
MRVQFVHKATGPERLLCEAEMVFDDQGPLDGMKLVGFSLWRGANGEVFVTFPSRAFGAGSDRKFFDFLRAADGPNQDLTRRVKSWIIDQYRESSAA